MHTWAPFNPEDHRMSARRLLSAWSVVALCALAVAVLSAISGTETNDDVTMTGVAQHHAAPWHVSRVITAERRIEMIVARNVQSEPSIIEHRSRTLAPTTHGARSASARAS